MRLTRCRLRHGRSDHQMERNPDAIFSVRKSRETQTHGDWEHSYSSRSRQESAFCKSEAAKPKYLQKLNSDNRFVMGSELHKSVLVWSIFRISNFCDFHFDISLRPVRLELTTSRFWDLCAADCAMSSMIIKFRGIQSRIFPSGYLERLKHMVTQSIHIVLGSSKKQPIARVRLLSRRTFKSWLLTIVLYLGLNIINKFSCGPSSVFLTFATSILILVCDQWGSNSRPQDFETYALPTAPGSQWS